MKTFPIGLAALLSAGVAIAQDAPQPNASTQACCSDELCCVVPPGQVVCSRPCGPSQPDGPNTPTTGPTIMVAPDLMRTMDIRDLQGVLSVDRAMRDLGTPQDLQQLQREMDQ